METLITIIIILLSYRLLLPFVAWIVPIKRMNAAAKYFEQTEKRFPIKDVIKSFLEWMKKRGDK